MNDKEKTETYLELYKAQLSRFNATRDFEWRINLALWSTIIITTGFLVGKVNVSDTAIWLFIIVYVWHFAWMIQIQIHCDFDEYIMNQYRLKIASLTSWKPPPPTKREWFVRVGWIPHGGFWWVVYETSFTALLLTLSWFILSNVSIST